eukprot:Blabericola_migrator_1__8598@NODE_44_length_16877_cov_133_659726_g40_i0_p3_GENE_NODE_44_length_16877_cov_133_659726_g40_i0NODE_44_length_16877_cov_133_659726_g40_i0_p3_ORF_typecomplete_len621_score83_04SDH_alpha/PF03313_15/2_7e79SDH_beta/PF03315_15/1_2e37Urocanase/PF01175_18/60Urocanase/PF01175_18/2_6_NODE_44_length_16877_cov_133_659726_g40_i01025312115
MCTQHKNQFFWASFYSDRLEVPLSTSSFSSLTKMISAPTIPLSGSHQMVCGSSRSLMTIERLRGAHPSSTDSANVLRPNPHESDISDPICTSIFDLFKIGPGPSSSHTMGPMKAAYDSLQDLRLLLGDSSISPVTANMKVQLQIHLHGSLSLTGRGHKTDTAIVGGLMGWLPESCDPDALIAFMTEPNQRYLVPIFQASGVSDGRPIINTKRDSDSPLSTASSPSTRADTTRSGSDSMSLGDLLSRETTSSLSDFEIPWCVVTELSVGAENFIWHSATPEEQQALPHPNTMVIKLLDNTGVTLLNNEYYSVGGGFIQKKGAVMSAGDAPAARPKYCYRNMKELQAVLQSNPARTWAEIILENELALTGASAQEVYDKLDKIINAMEVAVRNGLNTEGILPGSIGLHRRAAQIFEKAKRNAFKADAFLTFLNAYCQAASEENAAGRVVVTAPTSGSSGVFPGLIYFMKHHLFYPTQVLRDSLMVGGSIGFLVKRNASISGAEMGCMGEIGVAACMGAAMLTYAAGGDVSQCEAAAEIALEHHLGMTCDPVGGYVQIPCIQRNPMGAIKAYNAYVLAVSSDTSFQKVSLDVCINVMRETGRDMSSRYKETSEAGLATNLTAC